jgi:arginase family enzyme
MLSPRRTCDIKLCWASDPAASFLTSCVSHGIEKVIDLARGIIGETPMHVSFDIDSLDPECAPLTGLPVAS